MKHQIEKPSEHGMKFFTPELFLAFNSADEDEADRADEAWETALREYQSRLDRMWDQLPTNVRDLSELALHDAEILTCEEHDTPVGRRIAILSALLDGRVVTLIYALDDHIHRHEPAEPWPLPNGPPLWLYEELELSTKPAGHYVQRILCSDGAVIEIPFESVLIHRVSLPSRLSHPTRPDLAQVG
jgi:hypothetical protein